jgi:exopolysaccharide production protein ExoF
VVNARVLSIERAIAELEGKVLDMETAALRAKQDISKATQNATTLQNDRDAEVAQERQAAEAEIEKLNLKIAMYRDLMAEAMAQDPQAALGTGGDAAPAVSFSIVREEGEKTKEMAADENTPVLPGDVIKVGIAPVPAN